MSHHLSDFHSQFSKLTILVVLALALGATAQSTQGERKRNLVIREMNQKVGSNTSYLDNKRTYDHLGRKIEEIEYAAYGQKKRTTYEYEADTKRCIKEVVYNEKDKVLRIKKFEYNPDGTKARQYNYAPNGKLISTKVFEYSYMNE